MNNKNTLIIVGITIVITFSLTKVWDLFDSPLTKQYALQIDHEENDNHNEDEDIRSSISLSPDELEEYDIDINIAGPGFLEIHRDLTGEIIVDPDRLAHIGPRFPGIVKEVRKRLGDHVNKGEVLAVIESNESLTPYQVRSLISGTIIEMHLTQGEMVSESDHAFIVADLSEVWVNLSVYQKDLPYTKIGQRVEMNTGQELPPVNGIISYISPILDEHTRTAMARVILKNQGGLFRPGLFVSAKVIVDEIDANIIVPITALLTIEDKPTVFIKTQEGFEPQAVRLGRINEYNMEILSGLLAGQEYISKGGFTLKAQMAKGSLNEGHAH